MSQIGRVTVLTNPASGHGNAPHAAERAIARLQQRGVDVVAIVGTDAEHARRLVDESLDAAPTPWSWPAATASSRSRCRRWRSDDIPLGIIPAGTGNDHAREFGLPTRDPEAAADVVADGRTETVDLGRIRGADGTDRWFGTVMAAGFDSLVSDRTNRMSWPHGRMRYNVAMVAELSKLRLLPFRLTLDGDGTGHRPDAGRVRQHPQLRRRNADLPEADHSDGLLDVTMVHSASRTAADPPVPDRVQGHACRPRRRGHQAGEGHHRRLPGINAYADGEFVCPLPAEMSAVPGALRMLRP